MVGSYSLYGQINGTIALQGDCDSLVVVNIATIREANKKLLERDYLKELTVQQDSLINDLNILVDKYDVERRNVLSKNYELTKDIEEATELNNKLSKNLNNRKIVNVVLGSVAVTTTIVAVLSFLIK